MNRTRFLMFALTISFAIACGAENSTAATGTAKTVKHSATTAKETSKTVKHSAPSAAKKSAKNSLAAKTSSKNSANKTNKPVAHKTTKSTVVMKGAKPVPKPHFESDKPNKHESKTNVELKKPAKHESKEHAESKKPAIHEAAKPAETEARINPSGEPALSKAQSENLIRELRTKNLELPIKGFDLQKIKGSFYETHGGVQHGAADFVAARNTPVLAVEDGKIDKLFLSKAGGITVYQSDPTGKFIYYYAHLEKYAPGLHEGQAVHKGETIAFVGTSGNAPKNTPHLHFSVGKAQAPQKWWVTSSVDPYEVFK